MPPLPDQLRLAERTLRALVRDADLPAKIAVHPRPDASFGHAMPAWLRGPGADGTDDLMGIKWVTGFPENRGIGKPAICATLLLRAILDAGGITARRTAAVTGVAVARWAWSATGKPLSVALVGAGVQGESHLAMLEVTLPGSRVLIHDQDGERAERLAADGRAGGAFGEVSTRTSAAEAVSEADVVLTMVSFGPDRQQIPAETFERARLVVTVDYDMCLPASVARDAALFLVDELGQFQANRTGAVFVGYPDPEGIIGAHLDDHAPSGRVVVVHLGVGLADVVFGDAILRIAEATGRGVLLPR
jgi:ornithine cyclodeaminase/alanine dehydrogenase-like protein (mu-crystallin family)